MTKNLENADISEVLSELIENWENEVVEFKSATGQYSEDKIGAYFSAISNEANLNDQQYGWLILGVNEDRPHRIVGTNFKNGNRDLLEKFKYSISKKLTDGITFMDIYELYPDNNNPTQRVLMFKIPAATTGIPTAFNNEYYARSGDSLVHMPQNKIDRIRGQVFRDWSKQPIIHANIDDLDSNAIAFAREQYKEKIGKEWIKEDIDQINDADFLKKIKLIQNGHITRAAFLLLGKQEKDYLFEAPPKIMWRLYDSNGEDVDYCIISIPFLLAGNQVLKKIRNITYRYMTSELTLFPKETQQYDQWLLRELINNAIAHTNYRLGGRIYVDEFENHKIVVSNPGSFIPGSVQVVLSPGYNPPFYRNQLLSEAMATLNMIDTASSGIRRVFKIQRKKLFPMPDYDLTNHNKVRVTITGKVLDKKYSEILFNHPEINLEEIYLLDQVQKGNCIPKTGAERLRTLGLVEGRINNLTLSLTAARELSEEVSYIKNKGFDDQYYRDLILEYISMFGSASKKDVHKLLDNKLPGKLTEKQKDNKVKGLLNHLKNEGRIKTSSSNHQKARWILVK